jgi:hypothetical protein
METVFNGVTVWPGVIGSSRSATWAGWLIGLALGRAFTKETGLPAAMCPSHNWMIVERYGQLWVGESVSPQSKLTPLAEYERRIKTGEIRNVQLFEVRGVSRLRQAMAAEWWTDHILNGPYDWPAFVRLMFKAFFGDVCSAAAGLTWAHWCTEGVKDAYVYAGHDLYEGNQNPTPLTTIKRWIEGELSLVLPEKIGD